MTNSADTPTDLPDLAGKKVAIAGTFDDLGRMEARLGLEGLGATVVKELDAELDYVVAGAKGGPKLQQALALGIAHLDEPTLVALLAAVEQRKAVAVQDKGPKLPQVDGAVVIIAGTLEVMGRQAAKRKLEKLGAVVTDKLDGGVSFVVAGAKGGPTLFNAKQLGTPHIDESTLQALVAQLPEEDEDDLLEDGPPVMAGAVVVMAGIPSAVGRPLALRKLEKLGATVADRVDRNVKYVFVCQGGASALFQAKQHGIRELDEATLMELIADVTVDDEDGAAQGPGVEEIAGKKILIAGALQQVGRVEAKNKLTHLGAEVVDQLTDDVAYVVAGEDGGRNLFLAKQSGVALIEEPMLLTLLAQAPDVQTETGPAVPGPEALQGVRLVLAGKLPQVDRVAAKRKLARMGAQVVDKVDDEVTFVFAGEKGGRNVLVAMQQSLPIFDEDALVGLLAQIPDVGRSTSTGANGEPANELPDLRGHTVLLTGKLQHIDRRDAMNQLQQLGATLMDRVEDSPDFVIAGEKGGRAEFVAKQESIPILDETTLRAILDQAMADGVLTPSQDTVAEDSPLDLTGASLAFTGKFPALDLADLKQRLVDRGVVVHPGITADTQFVVVGEKPAPMKLFRAKKLGITQLDATDVEAYLNN